MKTFVTIISAAWLLCSCDSGTERMTAPPGEPPTAWLLPPRVEIAAPATGEDPISSSGALDISADSSQTGSTGSATIAQGERSGTALFHSCRKGDTIGSVAKAYGVDAGAVSKLNGWSAAYAPPAGTLVLLPRNMDNVAAAPDIIAYKIVQGDSLNRIANRHKLSVTALKSLNKLKNDNLKIGDVLYAPNMR